MWYNTAVHNKNMIIKQLKNVGFEWDEEKKELDITIWEETSEIPPMIPTTIKISKIHMFSLMRFIIRVLQKPTKKKK